MTKLYAGVIVGGPLDSQRMAKTEQRFSVQNPNERMKELMSAPPGGTADIGDDVGYERTDYEWTILQMSQDPKKNDIGVWAPRGSTKEEILLKLVARYQL